jgi:NAD(P)H-nitrite reductase large subunit
MSRYIIVGTGISGFSAAQTLRDLDAKADILLLSDDPHGFYSRPGLAYYLSGEIPEKQLFLFSRKGKLILDVQHLVTRVTSIDPLSHSIQIDPGGRLVYDRLLIATGSRAIPLKIPGTDLHGVVKLDNLDDTRRILTQVRNSKTAVVVGGGVVGLELTEGLAARGIKVHFLIRGDWFWSNILAEAEARMVEKHLAHDGVDLHHHTEIAEILSKNARVIGIRTASGEIIPCNLVAIGIGVKPCQELARAAGMKTDRGILVDEYLRTSASDVLAAGDVAQIFDPLTGRSSIDNLWYPGRKQGRIAALNMLGRTQMYQRTVAMNVLRLGGVMTTIIGSIGSGRDEGPVYTSRGSSETWQQLPNSIAAESGTDVSHLRLVLGEQQIIGAVVMGDQKLSRPLYEIINKRIDIHPIREQLLESGPQLGQFVMDYWLNARKK